MSARHTLDSSKTFIARSPVTFKVINSISKFLARCLSSLQWLAVLGIGTFLVSLSSMALSLSLFFFPPSVDIPLISFGFFSLPCTQAHQHPR